MTRVEKPAVFVLSQTPPRGERVREAEAGLTTLGVACPVQIVARAAYQDAHGAGLGVLEFDPQGKASTEIAQLRQWMTKKMERMTHDQEETHVAWSDPQRGRSIRPKRAALLASARTIGSSVGVGFAQGGRVKCART